ncbi:MAG: hypothetical protein QMC04_03180 [Ilumatobacter sp.]
MGSVQEEAACQEARRESDVGRQAVDIGEQFVAHGKDISSVVESRRHRGDASKPLEETALGRA